MINEHLSFGIDIGIASCGWAVMDTRDGRIEGMGTWMFDPPEHPKTRAPLNQARREARLIRRTLRRRRQRMAELKDLLDRNGAFAESAGKDDRLDPWACRARGLKEILDGREFAAALLHIGKHRGFKSSSKRAQETNEPPDEDGIVLSALRENEARMKAGGYVTAGEMFHLDPYFADRKRNRNKVYDRSIARDLNEREARILFAEQRRRGNPLADAASEAAFFEIAFRVTPRPDSEGLVGRCKFEASERRAGMRSPSFEEFRMLQKLTSLRLVTPDGPRALLPAEIAKAHSGWGLTDTLTYEDVRKRCSLPAEVSFAGLRREFEVRDLAVRKNGTGLQGTHALRKALGEGLWAAIPRPSLDRIADVVSFREERSSVAAGIEALDLGEEVTAHILDGWESGRFAGFRKAANISTLAARKLIPHMLAGDRYDQACAKAGYDHSIGSLGKRTQITDKAGFAALIRELDAEVGSPTARKSLIESLKQLWAMRNRWGLPGSIRVELARDIGKGPDERKAIEVGIDKATEERAKERLEAADQLGWKPEKVDGETLLKYRLWKEQMGRCCYTGASIPPTGIASTNNEYQVDHILPWSRFHDDSYVNKGLCLASANQAKGNLTPFEWIHGKLGEEAWQLHEARIGTMKSLKGIKKRNYLIRDPVGIEESFRSRNLNDTRFASRLFLEAAAFLYPHGERGEKDGRRRVLARPGQLTSLLRRAWGVESLKKGPDGKRLKDSRHHALDAAVVAATDEGALQALTRAFQAGETAGRAVPRADLPWPNFRGALKEAHAGVRCARPERRRARGKGHDATIRRISKTSEGGKVVIERKDLNKDFKSEDLKRFHDPVSNATLFAAVEAWIARGKPLDDLPLSPKGDRVRKISLKTKDKPAVMVRGGTADRAVMVRVDVFAESTRSGGLKWHLVPIYNYQAMAGKAWPEPPKLAVMANKPMSEWTDVVAAGFDFRMSLYPKSYVRMRKGEHVAEGYVTGFNIANATLTVSTPNENSEIGWGSKTLDELVKFQIDRFGEIGRVGKETRTWRGVACT